MFLWIINILPSLDQEHLSRLTRPSQLLGKQRHGNAVQGLQDILVRVGANLLLQFPLGPMPERPLDRLLPHHHKTLRSQHFGEFEAGRSVNAALLGRLLDQVAPLEQRRVRRRTAVVAEDGEDHLLHLQPAAGLQVVPALTEEARPVVDAQAEHASVYKVEFLVVHPVCFGVVNFELAIGGNPLWLDGGEVGAEDAC